MSLLRRAQRLGMTFVDLSRATGVGLVELSAMEHGKREVDPRVTRLLNTLEQERERRPPLGFRALRKFLEKLTDRQLRLLISVLHLYPLAVLPLGVEYMLWAASGMWVADTICVYRKLWRRRA